MIRTNGLICLLRSFSHKTGETVAFYKRCPSSRSNNAFTYSSGPNNLLALSDRRVVTFNVSLNILDQTCLDVLVPENGCLISLQYYRCSHSKVLLYFHKFLCFHRYFLRADYIYREFSVGPLIHV